MKYWDSANGCVKDDNSYNSYAPILDGGLIYREVYEVKDNLRLVIAYSEEDKKNLNMYDFRKYQCEKNGLKYSDLHKLIALYIPTEKYNEVYES